jgi:hypothetical protein
MRRRLRDGYQGVYFAYPPYPLNRTPDPGERCGSDPLSASCARRLRSERSALSASLT